MGDGLRAQALSPLFTMHNLFISDNLSQACLEARHCIIHIYVLTTTGMSRVLGSKICNLSYQLTN